MPLVKIKPDVTHRVNGELLKAGEVFDASPAEMESFGDKFVLVEDEIEPGKDVGTLHSVTSWTEVVMTTAARRLVQEHGISPSLSNITGTGKNGMITKANVVAFLNNAAEAVPNGDAE